MNDDGVEPPTAAQIPGALIDAELQRLAASRGFRRSPRHLRFLRHLVQATRDGQTQRLREMALGVEVFLRHPARFDPRLDTIVRVEARRLRIKLEAYYADEGLDARLQFVLPVGRYEVEIRRRSPRAPELRNRNAVAVYRLQAPAGADELTTAWATALSAELVATVQRLNGLRVVAAGVPPADLTAATARRVARDLQVDSLVVGQLVPGADGLRVALRLLRAEDGREMWRRELTCSPDHPLRALEPLARGIVSTLHRDSAERQLQRIRLSGSPPYVHALAGGGPTPRGMELLALARVAMRRNGNDDYRKALHLTEEAVTLMPGYAPAFGLLAEALLALVATTTMPGRPMLDSARRAAERALELDPELSDSHGQLGYLLFVDRRDWPAAEARLLEALRLAPALAGSHARYGMFLMMNRRYDEALAAYAEARDLDPLSLLYRCHAALVHLYARDYGRAASGLDAVLDIDAAHMIALALRAALHLYTGDSDAARRTYEAIQRHHPKLMLGLCGLAQADALQGRVDDARARLTQLQAALDAGYVSPYLLAMVQARLGDHDAALQRLDQAAQLSDPNFVCAGVDPCFDALRGMPEFQALLRTHGLGVVALPA